MAADFLIEKGYLILEKNWRYGYGEIDLIASDEATKELVIVEVKTRSTRRFGEPEASVSAAKMKKLQETAAAYREKTNHLGECRFDVIAISLEDENPIWHIEDAFY